MIKENILKEHISILKNYGLGDIDIKSLSLLTYESGEFLYLQGNTYRYILIFLSGRAKVFYTSANGNTLLIAYYTKSGIIGDSELMGNKKTATSSVQAITYVTCIGIPLDVYEDYLKNNLEFMNCVGVGLANKLHSSTVRSTLNILNSLDTRLCGYILMTNKNGYFREKLTELSEILGTSYRHLLRTLDKLCSEGILEKANRGYSILDMEEMKKRADEYSE